MRYDILRKMAWWAPGLTVFLFDFRGPANRSPSKATLSSQTIWTRRLCLQASILDNWVPCLNFAAASRAHFG
jgi:hypothetical protein